MAEVKCSDKVGPGVVFLRAALRMNFSDDRIPREEDVREQARRLRPIMDCTDEEFEAIIKQVLSLMDHKMDTGNMMSASDHVPWYMSRTRGKKMSYTRRNLTYLETNSSLSSNVINTLNQVTDEIMDGLGDPDLAVSRRYGLVMGDVQSGKTNTYTTLCCKAVDVGYKVVILLTGTLELLRKQTQSRMDEYFCGKDSAVFIKTQQSREIGVGRIDPSISVASFTSTEYDFNAQNATNLNIDLNDFSSPVLFVLKKNKTVLKNVETWLSYHKKGSYSAPLLLIDDEADYASINTARYQDEVTAINRSIRDILSLFQNYTYVGFTATPFANIFIAPEDEQDLYPNDFIYSLRAPNNYIGPRSMYDENGQYRGSIRVIPVDPPGPHGEGGLRELPYNHKKDFVLTEMPESLSEAIDCFMLSCAIRDLRGQSRSHMSMLVNVSRFTDVQNSAKDLIYEYVHKKKQAITMCAGLSEEEALRNADMARLKIVWDSNYRDTSYDWKTIQVQLYQSAMPIEVKAVNQSNGPKNLNYSSNPDGLRVIAVGGNSLSRGLTLEGLCVSYFYRRSKTYDTLMQMGRWFGYREGYDDLCRVWMTEESIEWYEGISRATDDLKCQFVMMCDRGKTPRDFGFRVRNDVTGLLVTSPNKMRNAGDDVVIKNLAGTAVWTSSIYYSKEEIRKNEDAISELISRINSEIPVYYNPDTGNLVWRKVPESEVASFINKFEYPENENILFDKDAIMGVLTSGDYNQDWDVVLQHGTGDAYPIPGVTLNPEPRAVIRSNIKKTSEGVLRFNSAALMSPNNMREGIYKIDSDGNEVSDLDRIAELEKSYKDSVSQVRLAAGKSVDNMAFPPKTYLMDQNRRPILIVYTVQVRAKPDSADDVREIAAVLGTKHTYGIAIGFPDHDLDPDATKDPLMIKYKTSVIYQKNNGNPDLDEESPFDE